MSPDDHDLAHLRRAIAAADRAVANGNHPFGSTLVDAAGTVAFEAENTVVTTGDVTGHAETNVVRMARGLPPSVLSGYTLYTSCEPCAMCSGAIYWAGIGRVVYALDEASLRRLTGAHPENPTLSLPCREVFARGSRAVAVTGPLIPEEAIGPHQHFWATSG